MTNNEQLSYLAGLLDGEGCLYIGYNNPHNTYLPCISISNNYKPILQWCKLLFGGCVIGRNNRRCSTWRLTGKSALLLIKELFCYLKIKKDEAKIFLEFEDTYNYQHRASTSGGYHKPPTALGIPQNLQEKRIFIKQQLSNFRKNRYVDVE